MVLLKWMWAMQTDAAFVGIDKALHLPLGRKWQEERYLVTAARIATIFKNA